MTDREDISLTALDGVTFDQAVPVYGAAFDEPYPEPALRDLVETSGSDGLVALSEGRVVGFVVWRVILDEAEIITVGVDPAHQGRGLGETLMRAAMAAAAKKATVLYLEVGADNPGALRLYLKLGFEHIGLRKNYYRRADRSRVDAHVMKVGLTG